MIGTFMTFMAVFHVLLKEYSEVNRSGKTLRCIWWKMSHEEVLSETVRRFSVIYEKKKVKKAIETDWW